jgi:hypothetical protein
MMALTLVFEVKVEVDFKHVAQPTRSLALFLKLELTPLRRIGTDAQLTLCTHLQDD